MIVGIGGDPTVRSNGLLFLAIDWLGTREAKAATIFTISSGI
jgi:hypothetical protein